jgi:hypothetical protein
VSWPKALRAMPMHCAWSGQYVREVGVQDIQRGVLQDINPLPWQTC